MDMLKKIRGKALTCWRNYIYTINMLLSLNSHKILTI